MNEDDLDLPVLPRSVTSISHNGLQRAILRKRPFASKTRINEEELAAAFNTSSDPAFFSSEDTPDLENYSGSKRRKKKVYSGTWWTGLNSKRSREGVEVSYEQRTAKHRKIQRNFDSGVFMADETSSSEWSSDPAALEELSQAVTGADTLSAVNSHRTSVASSPVLVPQDTAAIQYSPTSRIKRHVKDLVPESAQGPHEEYVTKVVRDCLRHGREDVSLIGLGLDSLPSSIAELKQLTRFGTPGTYKALVPQLKLYLGNNNFSQFPASILQLKDLGILSVRQNQLTEIPPTISALDRLNNLNISCNNLQWLPYEMLDLLHENSLELHCEPNPWIPQPATTDQLENAPLLERSCIQSANVMRSLRRIAVSVAQEKESAGGISRRRPVVNQYMTTSRVPYLTEIIARNMAKKDLLPQDPTHAEDFDQLPPTVQYVMKRVYDCQKVGGYQCTFCKKAIILPRFTWLEWWAVTSRVKTQEDQQPTYSVRERLEVEDQNGQILPFLRQACGCQSQSAGLLEEAKGYISSRDG